MKLAEAVAQQLLTVIRSRALLPGTRLPSERELMDMLQVGRSTVREALRGLVLLGVVEVRHGQGNFVASVPKNANTPDGFAAILSSSLTRDLLEARRLVEIQIARLAAERRTDGDLREMETTLQRDADVLEYGDSPVTSSASSVQMSTFHVALCRATHNEVLEGFVQTYRGVLARRAPSLAVIPGYRVWEHSEHTRLLDAVRYQDVERAGELMQLHLIQAEQLYAQILRGDRPRRWPD
jgi:GntR family transcriptional repressor for pyruvate dehydrogenase complex